MSGLSVRLSEASPCFLSTPLCYRNTRRYMMYFHTYIVVPTYLPVGHQLIAEAFHFFLSREQLL